MARSKKKQDWTPRELQEGEGIPDLWAVRVYEGGRGPSHWVTVGIFHSREGARRLRETISRDHRRDFPLVEPVMFHPNRGLAAAWVAAGNRIGG